MQFIVEQIGEGVVRAEASSPVNHLEIFRIQRQAINAAPEEPGVYFLVGTNSDSGKHRIYVGQSKSKKTGIKKRLKDHKNDKGKEFFGEVFAVPLADPTFAPGVEAEFIKRIQQAEGQIDSENVSDEKNSLGGFPAAVQEFCNEIQEALAVLIGKDVFADEAAAPQAAGPSSSEDQADSSVSLNTLIEAGLLDQNEALIGSQGTRAFINEDGSLTFDGVPYASLSRAAKAARQQLEMHPSVNGWTFWHVDRDGSLETLKSLRDSLG